MPQNNQQINLPDGEFMGNHLKVTKANGYTLSITDYQADAVLANHCHENSYISILIDGIYEEIGERKIDTIHSGEILFRPSGYEHRNKFRGNKGKCFNIELNPDFADIFTFPVPEYYHKYRAGEIPSFYQLFIAFSADREENVCDEYLIDWLASVNELKIKKSLRWVDKAKSILQNELDHFHSLSELADRLCVHPVYLSRAFKEKTRMTISDYQLQHKLTSALQSLLSSSESISSISHTNGFYDDAHFIRSFRSRYGLSPYQFRKLFKS